MPAEIVVPGGSKTATSDAQTPPGSDGYVATITAYISRPGASAPLEVVP